MPSSIEGLHHLLKSGAHLPTDDELPVGGDGAAALAALGFRAGRRG